MLIRRRTLIAASAATAIASPAIAQNYPRRAVQLIVAFPAGGARRRSPSTASSRS
jgi:tripartite-type tricarboxylate transporter receptor subunit TctC